MRAGGEQEEAAAAAPGSTKSMLATDDSNDLSLRRSMQALTRARVSAKECDRHSSRESRRPPCVSQPACPSG